MTGKIIFIIYLIIISIIGICGAFYEPKESKLNVNCVFVLFIILYIMAPMIANFCGLYQK